MKTSATPGSEGKARSRLLKASRPPAEAPTAAIGNATRGEVSFSSACFVSNGMTFARAATFFLEVGIDATWTIPMLRGVGYWRSILVHEHREVKTVLPRV